MKVHVKFQDREIESKLYVTDRSKNSVMGREWLFPLEIVKIADIKKVEVETETTKDQIVSNYADLFKPKIGKIPNIEIHLEMKPDARPKYIKPYKIPYAMITAVGKEID